MTNKKRVTEALWSLTSEPKTYAFLPGDIEVDVAIVGAGITGLSTAYHLINAGKKVAVVEAFQIGKGTTGSSTGNLYAPIDERLFSIEKKHGVDTLRSVVASRLFAINFIEQRVREFNIDCDFRRVPFHLFAEPEDKASDTVEKELKAAKKALLPVTDTVSGNFPFNTDRIMTIPEQAQFNPLEYVHRLAAGIEGESCRIFENTKVIEVVDGDPCVVHTNKGIVKSKKVALATHTPKGLYAVHASMEVYREYALAAKLKEELPEPGIYWNAKSPQYSIRPYYSQSGNFLLILGEPYKGGHTGHGIESIRKIEGYMKARFQVDQVEFAWAAQNYKPADNIPYIGISPMEKNIYIATGFAADGLVYGTLAGKIIGDLISGRDNEWAQIYSPGRFTPAASALKFVKENISVSAHLLKDYLFYGEIKELHEVKPGEGKTLTVNNEKVAAYRDEKGNLNIVSSVCPHMGCIVHWNDVEKSWDCSCHGSRFNTEGEVLEGPALHNLAKPENIGLGNE